MYPFGIIFAAFVFFLAGCTQHPPLTAEQQQLTLRNFAGSWQGQVANTTGSTCAEVHFTDVSNPRLVDALLLYGAAPSWGFPNPSTIRLSLGALDASGTIVFRQGPATISFSPRASADEIRTDYQTARGASTGVLRRITAPERLSGRICGQ